MQDAADTGQIDGQTVLETTPEPTGPPDATVTRRAQSYSDFHYAVSSVLGAEDDVSKKDKDKEVEITNDLDFVNWYCGLEHDLLESSHGDYALVSHEPLEMRRR